MKIIALVAPNADGQFRFQIPKRMKTVVLIYFVANALIPAAMAQLTLPGLKSELVNITKITVPPSTCLTQPPNFPLSSPTVKQDFENWGETVQVKNLWKAVPHTSDDIVTLANWAFKNNYTIRPLGKMHNWSPLTVTEASDCGNTLLVDTTQYLIGIEVFPNGIENYTFPVVKAQSGVLLEKLLEELELKGFGFTASAAVGKITIGGLFAIAGHGYAVKVANSSVHLKNYGSVVNRIVKIEAVAWNKESQSYSLQTFDRSMNEISALMTHVGLAFITSMTLRVEENFKIRCISHTEIPNSEVFANPVDGQNARTFVSFLEISGRVAVVSFPYVNFSWLMQCTDVDICPPESRQVQQPYNYPFIKSIPKSVSDLLAAIQRNFPFVTPPLLNFEFEYVKAQLIVSESSDICGPSKNLLLYVEPDTTRFAAFSYAILTKRENIQQIVYLMKNKLETTLQRFQEVGSFPMNGALETRATELDNPNDIGLGARKAFLAMTTPAIDYPQFNVALYFEISTFEGTPGFLDLYSELESYIISTFNGTLGLSRPEWSKGFAVSPLGEWTNTSVMHDVIAKLYPDWDEFVSVCNNLDPHKIFRNDFLNELFS